MTSAGSTPTARRLVGLLLALAVLAGCSDGQDPGLEPGAGGGSQSTSNTLAQCPAGGPDETTSPAGCIGPEGNVLRP